MKVSAFIVKYINLHMYTFYLCNNWGFALHLRLDYKLEYHFHCSAASHLDIHPPTQLKANLEWFTDAPNGKHGIDTQYTETRVLQRVERYGSLVRERWTLDMSYLLWPWCPNLPLLHKYMRMNETKINLSNLPQTKVRKLHCKKVSWKGRWRTRSWRHWRSNTLQRHYKKNLAHCMFCRNPSRSYRLYR